MRVDLINIPKLYYYRYYYHYSILDRISRYIYIYISCEFLPNSSQKVSGAREKRKKEREGGSDLERGAIGRGPGRKCTRGRDCARRM